MEDAVKIKKTRKPRSEEAKQAAREKMLARAAKLREENDGKAVTPETSEKISNAAKKPKNVMRRKDGSKATHLIVEILDLINDLHRAEESDVVLKALQQFCPEMKFEYNQEMGCVRFSRSVVSIRDEFGAVGLEIWRKVFVCIQQGGFSTRENAGYATIWSLNKQNWDVFTVSKIRIKSKRNALTVSAFMDAIKENDELKRVGTQMKVVEVEGKKQIQTSNKQMTTKEQRAELAAKRKQLKEKHGIGVKPTVEEQAVLLEEIREIMKCV